MQIFWKKGSGFVDSGFVKTCHELDTNLNTCISFFLMLNYQNIRLVIYMLFYNFAIFFQMDFQITGIDNMNLIEKDDFENNPWFVEDASVFLKYCCPECDYQILNYDMFSYHALENHVKSKVLFESNEQKT